MLKVLDVLLEAERKEAMKLFEITTSHWGNSYERTYVWAKDEQRARDLFAREHKDRKAHDVRVLLSNEDLELVTKLSSDGWE